MKETLALERLRYDQIEIWLVTLFFSVRRNSPTESLDGGVEKVEKSSRMEYRKVLETTSSIGGEKREISLALLLPAIHHPRLTEATALGCYLKSIRHANQTPEAFNKSLGLKMKKGKNR